MGTHNTQKNENTFAKTKKLNSIVWWWLISVPKNIPSSMVNSLWNQTHQPNTPSSINKVQSSRHLSKKHKNPLNYHKKIEPKKEKKKELGFRESCGGFLSVPILGLIQLQHLCNISSYQYCFHKTHIPSWILISQLSLPYPFPKILVKLPLPTYTKVGSERDVWGKHAPWLHFGQSRMKQTPIYRHPTP